MRQLRRTSGSRRGLAPVELVLAIPLVLFVVALSVIIGAVSCWKVRGRTVARDTIFSRRYAHWQTSGPQPPEWRVAHASNRDRGGPALTELDDPVFQNPLIRGPLPGIPVDHELLDTTNHARMGEANLVRSPAALPRLGPYSLDVELLLVDGKWQFWQLGIPGNTGRRLRRLYDLLNAAGTQEERALFFRASAADERQYRRSEMNVLDRDDEFLIVYGYSPNFYPRLVMTCSLEPDDVREQTVKDFIDRIEGLPRTIARAFISMYQYLLNLPEECLTPAQRALRTSAEAKIQILEAFLATLD